MLEPALLGSDQRLLGFLLAVMLPARYSTSCPVISGVVLMCFTDVVKSRVQLRKTPPVGTPVQYIARELKEIVVESRSWVMLETGFYSLTHWP